MLSAQLVATIPTGSHSNGSPDSAVAPTLLSGKGFGKFDVISCLGGTLPTEETNKLGRSIAWNTTAQYHLAKYVWPELEANTTYFFGGKKRWQKAKFRDPGHRLQQVQAASERRTSRTGVAVRCRHADCHLAIPHLQPRAGFHHEIRFLAGAEESLNEGHSFSRAT